MWQKQPRKNKSMTDERKWEQFEKQATQFLQSYFGQYATFTHQGSTDSTVSDILVNTPTQSFYVEAKTTQAQSGQFVVFPARARQQFIFSPKNKSEPNEVATIIIGYMNAHWQQYQDVSTNGLNLDMNDQIFATWIVNHYKQKHVRYFVSGTIGHFILVPIDDFATTFTVSATYRRKRSGTRPLPKKEIPRVHDYLVNLYPQSAIVNSGKHSYLITQEQQLDKTFFSLEEKGALYYLTHDGKHDGYRISVRSQTNNPNVIFSLKLKDNVVGLTHDEFVDVLTKDSTG